MQTTTIPQFIGSLRYRDAASPTPAEVSKRVRFLEKFPDQEVNILSYQDNPGCKCAGLIFAAISSVPDQAAVLTYIEGSPISIVTPFQAVGSVITIDDTPEAYAALHQRIQKEKFMFRGLSVAAVTVDGVAKLKVFFY